MIKKSFLIITLLSLTITSCSEKIDTIENNDNTKNNSISSEEQLEITDTVDNNQGLITP